MDLTALQSQLGYTFRQEKLLIQSLTHPSYMILASEEEFSNQRLEFLGDAVLQLVISDYLYSDFPDIREGLLTQYRSILVESKALVEIANKLNISSYLRVSNSSSKQSPKELLSSREDALEAIIGAIYLDSDLATTKKVVLAWFDDLKERLAELKQDHNPKGRLQELLQPKMGNEQIQYKVIEASGPPHERIFKVELTVGDQSVGKAKGRSIKEAEEKAARKALDTFESPDA